MSNTKFDYNLLSEILKNYNAILKSYTEPLTRNSIIYFKCNCGDEYNKNFRVIYNKGGAFCKKCTLKNQKEKTKNTKSNSEKSDNRNNNLNNSIKLIIQFMN